MKKTIRITMFYGLAALCFAAHAAESRERPPVLPGHAMTEVRIDASAIRQRIKEKKISPLPDAVNKFHGGNDQARADSKRSHE